MGGGGYLAMRERTSPRIQRGAEEMSRGKAKQNHQRLAVVFEPFRSSLQIKMYLQVLSLALSYHLRKLMGH